MPPDDRRRVRGGPRTRAAARRDPKLDALPAVAPLRRLFKLRAAAMAMAAEAFRPLNLGLKQATLLTYLSNNEGEPSASEFCKATGTNSAAMVRLVDSLEKRGLVARRDDPRGDRRRWAIVLTLAGEDLATEVNRRSNEIRREVLAALSAREIRTLVSILEKAIRTFEQRRAAGR